MFTFLGRIAAWLALIMAAGRIGTAIYLVTAVPSVEEAQAMAQRYLGTTNIPTVIDQAAMVAAFAIGLGILTEISLAVRNRNT